LGTAGIACAALFVRAALPAPPVVTGFYRVALATAVLWGVLWLRGRWRFARADAWPALAAGAFFGADMALWNSSVVATSVANATLLVNTTPLLVGAYAVVVQGERLGRRFLGGAALALCGVGMLLASDLQLGASLEGDVLALAAALFYAAYLLIMKSVRRTLDAMRAVALAGISASAVLAAAAIGRGDPFSGFPLHSWLAFVALAGVSHLAGVLGIVWALRELRATFASVALLAQPLGTALLGWWLLGEALTPLQTVGGGAVMFGILFASRAAREAPRPDRQSEGEGPAHSS
jgi:drug/metabolite transporter (DMT)-like permease